MGTHCGLDQTSHHAQTCAQLMKNVHDFPFRYETHLHTSEGSACGRSTAAEMVNLYANAGFSGIFITDHFFNGNCAVDRSLPWADRVDGFLEGYRNACTAAEGSHFQVFFGFEYSNEGTDFLIYGLDGDFLLRHPDIDRVPVDDFFDPAREAGAFIVQAHPFRQRPYIPRIRLFHRQVDALEVFNGADDPVSNSLTEQFAQANGIPGTAGSDNHCADRPPVSGMAFRQRLESAGDYARAVRNGEGIVLKTGSENGL